MTPQEKVNKLDINKILTKYLNYVFANTDWQYDNLTTVEKTIISKEEFKLLKEAYELDINKIVELDINKIVEKYLNYIFPDIDWQYDNVEKAIMSKKEFKLLKEVYELDINKIVEKYLNYTFADIDWQYDNLTTVEKAIMSKEEFNLLKEVYHSDDECYAKPKQETLEEVRKVEKSDLYNKIHSIVKQIPRKEVEGDAMDAPSCAYELEQLFYKWQAEKMYSEEEVYNLLCSMPNFYSMTIPQQVKARDKWFNQFKKK